MKYRPEIDGLRAIAVVSVLLYHAGFTISGMRPFDGGFVGVDIFFVISGYLITAILLREMREGNFSFMRFYERRARRILPALFTVMLVSIPFAWAFMFPGPFEDYARSIVSSTLFASNIQFWREDAYTAEPSSLKPFLHTWSLSVEEQFYLLFPILLLICWKLARARLTTIMIVGALLSLAGAELTSRSYPSASFFLLPTRGWELLGGAILAALEVNGRTQAKAWRSRIIPAVGLVMVLSSIFLLEDKMVHPGLVTAIPVLGTMAIIMYGGGGDLVSRLLSGRPLVAIGLISYSLYLWHQPILAFARLRSVNALNDMDKLACIALAVALAVLSWRFVEQPFRNRALLAPRRIWQFVAVGMVALVGVGWAGMISDGFGGRWKERVPVFAEINPAKGRSLRDESGKRCWNRNPEAACRMQPQAELNWIVVGDSHARVLTGALWDEVRPQGAGFVEMTNSGCPYAPGMAVFSNGEATTCTTTLNDRRRDALLRMKPGIVVIHGRLPVYLSGDWFDNREGGVEPGPDFYLARPETRTAADAQRIGGVMDGIAQSIRELMQVGHKIVLVYPVPEVGWDVPQTLAKLVPREPERAKSWVDAGGLTVSAEVVRTRMLDAYSTLDAVEDNLNLLRIYPSEIFCDTRIKGRCITHDERVIFYADDNHLSEAGAKLVVQKMLDAVQNRWNRVSPLHEAAIPQ